MYFTDAKLYCVRRVVIVSTRTAKLCFFSLVMHCKCGDKTNILIISLIIIFITGVMQWSLGYVTTSELFNCD